MAAKKVFALDLGTNSIKCLSLANQNNHYVVERLAISPLPPAEIDKSNPLKHKEIYVQTIRKTIKEAKLSNIKNVIFSISGDFVVIRFIAFQKMDRAELNQAIINEAEQYIPFNINDVVISADIVAASNKNDSSKMDIIMAAGKKFVIQQYLEIIESAGLNPYAVDTDVSALSNLYRVIKPYKESDDIVALINIGAFNTVLILFDKDQPVFSRDIGLGGDNITKIIENDFSCGLLNAETFKKKYAKIKPEIAKKSLLDLDIITAKPKPQIIPKIPIPSSRLKPIIKPEPAVIKETEPVKEIKVQEQESKKPLILTPSPPPPPQKIDGDFKHLVSDIAAETKSEPKAIDDIFIKIGRIKKPPSIEGGSGKIVDIKNIKEEEIVADIGIVLSLLLPQIINDITRSMNYYESQNKGRKITRMFITGGSSNIEGLFEFLSQRLGIPVERLNIKDFFLIKNNGDSDKYTGIISSLPVALGIGLRALEG
ncbi:MAG: pilus assembly protein PilM [Candidatus Hydrogenedentota bacterium]